MNLLNIYLAVSTIGMIFIAAIWSKKTLLNVAIKAAYVATSFVGIVLTLKAFNIPLGLG